MAHRRGGGGGPPVAPLSPRALALLLAVLAAPGAVHAQSTAPAQVTGVTVTPNYFDSLDVSWTAVTGATGYTVQYKTGSAAFTGTDPSASATTNYATLENLSEGTQYRVRVRATNSTGDGAWSAEATGVTDKVITSRLVVPDEIQTTLGQFVVSVVFGEPVTIEASDFSVQNGRVTADPVATPRNVFPEETSSFARIWSVGVTPERPAAARTSTDTGPFDVVITLIEGAYIVDYTTSSGATGTKITAFATATHTVDELPLKVEMTAEKRTNEHKVDISFTEAIKSDCDSSDTDDCTLDADEVSVTNGVFFGLVGAGQSYVVFVRATGTQQVTVNVASGAVKAASGGEGNAAGSINLQDVSIARPSATITGPSSPRGATYTAANKLGSFEITITFSTPVTGLTADDFQVANATIGTPEAQSPSGGYATIWKAAVTPTSPPGAISVLLPEGKASQSSGDTNAQSNGWAIVIKPGPSATITGPSEHRGTDSFDITITFSAPVTGLAADDFIITNATIGTPTAQSPSDGSDGYATVWTAAVTPSSPGNVSVQVKAGAVSVSGGGNNPQSHAYSIVVEAGGL